MENDTIDLPATQLSRAKIAELFDDIDWQVRQHRVAIENAPEHCELDLTFRFLLEHIGKLRKYINS